jgi:hypothetical protein
MKIAVMDTGAVGCHYGGMLGRGSDAPLRHLPVAHRYIHFPSGWQVRSPILVPVGYGLPSWVHAAHALCAKAEATTKIAMEMVFMSSSP